MTCYPLDTDMPAWSPHSTGLSTVSHGWRRRSHAYCWTIGYGCILGEKESLSSVLYPLLSSPCSNRSFKLMFIIDALGNSMAHKTRYWRCGSVAKRLAALPDDLVLSQNPYNNTQLWCYSISRGSYAFSGLYRHQAACGAHKYRQTLICMKENK